MTKKTCSKCGEEKELSEFHKAPDCRLGVRPECKFCSWKRNDKNKAHTNKLRRERNKNNPRLLAVKRAWNLKNKDRTKAYDKKRKKKTNIRQNLRYANDPDYRLMIKCQRRLKSALNGATKISSFTEALGCDVVQLKEHLQATAQLRYGHETVIDWDTYSGFYHRDHIVPISLFDLQDPEQFKLANHYTNLQLLTHSENLSKGCKLLHLEFITPELQSFVNSL